MRYTISFLAASAAATASAWAEVPSVVTDIPPVHSLVAAVMGDLGQPVLLLDRGASPHGFQLRPSQAGAVADADLAVWIGPELSPWLEKALANRSEGASTLALLQAEGTHLQAFAAGEEEAHDQAAEDHDSAEDDHAGEDHAGEDHDHAGLDPHAWLDPANGKLWLGLIAADLSRLDPENASLYAANAAAAAAAIAAADAEAAAMLAPVKDRPFVTFHDAYGYFTAHYGLKRSASVALGDAVAPGARHLAELRDRLAEGGAFCVFPEAQHDPALLLQVAEGSGVAIGAALDPSGSTMEPGPRLYPALILSLAGKIAACAP